MQFRTLSILALAAAAVAAPSPADIEAGGGAVGGVKAGPIDAGLAAGAGAQVDLPTKDLTNPGGPLAPLAGVIPALAPGSGGVIGGSGKTARRFGKRDINADLGVGLNLKLGTLDVGLHLCLKLKIVTGKLTELLKGSDLSGAAKEIEALLKELTSTLETEGVDLLNGVLTDVTGVLASLESLTPKNTQSVTNQAAVNPLSEVFTTVSTVFNTLHGVEKDIPGLGPILDSATTEVQGALKDVISIVGQIAGPLLAELQGLLAPVEGILSSLGLCAVNDLVNSILGTL